MLKVSFVRAEDAVALPERSTPQSAGYDVRAFLPNGTCETILPGRAAKIGTGLKLSIPPGYECQVRPRSGLAFKHSVTVLNAPGTIDADYRGEVGILLINHGNEPFVVNHGDRIAQLVFAAVAEVSFEPVTALEDTLRAAGGFGSTGKK